MRILREKTMMQRKKKIQVLWILIWFVQNRSLYFVFCIILNLCLYYFYSVCYRLLFMKKKKPKKQTQPTNKQTDNPKETNSKRPKTRNLERTVSVFSALAWSCATLNLVYFSSSDTVDTVSNQDGCHYGTHEIYCWHFQPYIFGSAFIFL